MRFILTILGGMIALDAIWWMVSTHLAQRRLWRQVIAVFMVAQIVGLLWLIGCRMAGNGGDRLLPKFAIVAIFNWHFFGLALVIAIGVVAMPVLLVRFGWRLVARSPRPEPSLVSEPGWTRRDFLGAAVAVAPPLFTLAA